MINKTADELDFLDITAIHGRLGDGELSSVEVTQRCLDRIATLDPELNAVIALDPTARTRAAESDLRHAHGADLGPLDGIPVLVKDNIDTAHLASTVGSKLLAGTTPARDADVVARLRAAGAVVLGKTNLSEWSNFRSIDATEGWSAVGGQTHHPYLRGRSPWGSSSGSAVAVAAGMAPLALGTETDGSIVGPAGACGVVGLKPEFGLLPLRGVAGVSSAIDTVGPLASRVRDAAICLAVLADRPELLRPTVAGAGCRIGVWRPAGLRLDVAALLLPVVEALADHGIDVVDIEIDVPDEIVADGMFALYSEFRGTIEDYLRDRNGADSTVPVSLPDLIAANDDDPDELALFGQDLFERIAGMSGASAPAARAARDRARAASRAVLDDALRDNGIDVILAPTNEPAWQIDYDRGDSGRLSTSTLPALAGAPNVSLPAGLVDGLPVGVSLFGPPTSARLLGTALLVEGVLGPRPWPDLL